MDDPWTAAGVVGSLVLAAAAIGGLFIERSKRKADEAALRTAEGTLATLGEGVKKVGSAVLELEHVVEQMRNLSLQAGRAVVLAEQGALWAKVGVAANAVRTFINLLDRFS